MYNVNNYFITQIFIQEQSEQAKRAFINKTSREQRTQQREQARILSPEEVKQLQEQKRKQEVIDFMNLY